MTTLRNLTLSITLTALAGCGVSTGAPAGILAGQTNGQRGATVAATGAQVPGFDPEARRVVLRIPRALIQEVQQKVTEIRDEETRRNAVEGPFIRYMEGGFNPVTRLAYQVELSGYGLHVSADGFRGELEELTYMNGREFDRNGDLLVPYWKRPGTPVSFYFTISPMKTPLPLSGQQAGVQKPIPLPVRYVSNFGWNYDSTLGSR